MPVVGGDDWKGALINGCGEYIAHLLEVSGIQTSTD